MNAAIRVTARGAVSWDTLKAQLPVPEGLPLVDALEGVTAQAEFRADISVGAGGNFEAKSILGVDLTAPRDPELFGATFDRHLRVEVELGAALGSEVAVSGALTLSTRVRLPPPPDAPLLSVTPGDDEGWMGVVAHAAAEGGSAGGDLKLAVTLSNVGSVGIFLPGLARAPAPLSASIESISGFVSISAPAGGARSFTAELSTDTSVHLHPQLDPAAPRAMELVDSLLGAVDIDAGATLTVTLRQDAVSLRARLWDPADRTRPARIETDVFGLLKRLTGSGPVIASAGSSFRVGAELAGFSLELGATPSIAVGFGIAIGNTSVPFFVELSTKSLALGMGARIEGQQEVAIPLFLRPAIDASTIAALRKEEKVLCAPILETFDRIGSRDGKQRFLAATGALWDTLAVLGGAAPVSTQPPWNGPLFYKASQDPAGGWHLETPEGREPPRGDLPFQAALGFTNAGQAVVLWRVGNGDFTPLAVHPRVVFKDFSISVPFQNLQDISVRGTVGLEGFESFLTPLNGKGLTLGLSADLVYFELKSDPPQTFVVPDMGGYTGGQITVGAMRLGIGIPRRSFSAAFQGELILPDKLIDDLDISKAGAPSIRLPKRASVGFRFDLTPVVIGKVVIPFPSLQFDIDLRRTGAALAAQRDEPVWDGLQFIIPGWLRASFERLSYNPTVLFYSSGNSNFQGDLQLGDGEQGLTLVVEGGYWAWGIDCYCAYVLAPIASIPFFARLSLRVAFAWFGLHLSLERPVPTFSPFALFEMMAVISDPQYPVPRRGELSDLVRVTLRGVELTLPEAVARVLPALPSELTRELELTLNLGTFIRLLQQLGRALEGMAGAIQTAVRAAREGSRELPTQPRMEEVTAALLRLLPESMRSFQLRGSLGGFASEINLVLASAAELADARPKKPLPSPVGRLEPGIRIPAAKEVSWLNKTLTGLNVEQLAWDPSWGSYVLASAMLQVVPGAQARFVGMVGAKGRVRMMATEQLPKLPLRFTGVDAPIQLACQGALTLDVTPRDRGAGEGRVSVSMTGAWDVPGLLSLQLTSPDGHETSATVWSDGRFTAEGDAKCQLFNGTATLQGHMQLTQEMASLSNGSFRWSPLPGLSISVDDVTGHMGPGLRFAFSGRGSVVIAGRKASNVRVDVSETGVTFEATLDTPSEPRVPGLPELEGRLAVAGTVSCVAGQASARLRCRGELGLKAPLGISLRGQGEMLLDAGGLDLSMNGELRWLGREWLGAGLSLSARGGKGAVEVSGVSNFRLEPEIPAAVRALFPPELPKLAVAGSLSAKARLDLGGAFSSAGLGGSLSLAIRSGRQDFPLAVFGGEWQGRGVEGGVEVVLLSVDRLSPLPGALRFTLREFPTPVAGGAGTLQVGTVLTPPFYLMLGDYESPGGSSIQETDPFAFTLNWPKGLTNDRKIWLPNGIDWDISFRKASLKIWLKGEDKDIPSDLSMEPKVLAKLGKKLHPPFFLQWKDRKIFEGNPAGAVQIPIPSVEPRSYTVEIPPPELGLPTEPLELVLTLGGPRGLRFWWRRP